MPPRKDNSPVIRAKIASGLGNLAQLLDKEKVLRDVRPLYKAAEMCRRNDATKGIWGYDVEPLIFRDLGKIKVFQNEFDISNATITFSMTVKGKCEPSEDEDPLTALGLQIVLEGAYMGDDDVKLAFSAWHLDRHNSESDSAFLHPLYHLSFGGMHLESQLDKKNTSVMLADTPRIVHLPMDAILGIDFVLTNFWQTSALGFRNEGAYVNLLAESQRNLWKPYFDTLHGFWQPNSRQLIWSPLEIIPELVNNR
ncbi:MAG: hypothetical protein HY869_22370 [Chloroflexi bacterium]|nr:hypothetical protein [Chloroflexota bacterium]